MNISSLDADVYEALRGRRHTDEDIAAMSVKEAFSEYCEWQGLRGWAPTLIEVMRNLEDCK